MGLATGAHAGLHVAGAAHHAAGVMGPPPISTPGVVPSTPTTIAMTSKDGQVVISTAFMVPDTDPSSNNPSMALKYPEDSPLAKVTIATKPESEPKPPKPVNDDEEKDVDEEEKEKEKEKIKAKEPTRKALVAWFPTPPVFIAKRHVSEIVGRHISGFLFEDTTKQEEADSTTPKAGFNGVGINGTVGDGSRNGSVGSFNALEMVRSSSNNSVSGSPQPVIKRSSSQLEDEQRQGFVVGHSAKYLAWKRQKIESAKSAGSGSSSSGSIAKGLRGRRVSSLASAKKMESATKVGVV